MIRTPEDQAAHNARVAAEVAIERAQAEARRVRIHWTDVPIGFRVWHHGVLFQITETARVYHGQGHGHRDNTECGYPCKESDEPQSSHHVIAFEGRAVGDVFAGTLQPFVRKEGDPWTFQYRGDLAWFETSTPYAW